MAFDPVPSLPPPSPRGTAPHPPPHGLRRPHGKGAPSCRPVRQAGVVSRKQGCHLLAGDGRRPAPEGMRPLPRRNTGQEKRSKTTKSSNIHALTLYIHIIFTLKWYCSLKKRCSLKFTFAVRERWSRDGLQSNSITVQRLSVERRASRDGSILFSIKPSVFRNSLIAARRFRAGWFLGQEDDLTTNEPVTLRCAWLR